MGTVDSTAAIAGGNAHRPHNVISSTSPMHRKTLFLSSLALSALLTGCVGTGPNTQQGAVSGAALGAIAGAIIGNNSGNHDAGAGALIGALAGGIAGGTMGNAVDNQNGTLYGYPEGPRRGYYRTRAVEEAPPAPPAPLVDNVTPSLAPNALWVPGYWDFNGNGYTWTAGHWEIPPPASTTYVAAHWENRPEGNVFVRAYWR